MAAAKKEGTEKVTAYIETLPEWSRNICSSLREIILKADDRLLEEWKWGPHYSSKGMVCGYGAFQKHIKLTFFNGSAMTDPEGAFNHCVDNEFSRSIKFVEGEEMNKEMLTAYIKESVDINHKGFKRAVPDKEVVVPGDLEEALLSNKTAHQFFHGLTYGYKKDFVAYITGAKQEKTRLDRISKVVLLAAQGRRLNDQYNVTTAK
jgi:hypothetical protein